MSAWGICRNPCARSKLQHSTRLREVLCNCDDVPFANIGCGVTTGQWTVVAQGAYTALPANEAQLDVNVYPLLGPMGGGTEIMLEVSCNVFLSICIHHFYCHLAEPRQFFGMHLHMWVTG